MSSQMAAFLAEERARRQQEGGDRQQYAGDMERLPKSRAASGGDRSLVLAYVLWWFATPFAAHRFYLRATQSAFAMLGLFWGGLALGLATGSGIPAIAIGLWFLWVLADLFLIPGLTRRANESAGSMGSVFA